MDEEEILIESEHECPHCGAWFMLPEGFMCGEATCTKCGKETHFSFETSCGMFIDP